MFEIVVNTEQLRSKSEQLDKAAKRLVDVQGEIESIIGSVDPGAYEGQLMAQVKNILEDAKSDAARLSGQVDALRDELVSRADLFDKANQVVLATLATILSILSLGYQKPTSSSSSVPNSPVANWEAEVKEMSWHEIFEEKAKLETEIKTGNTDARAKLDILEKEITTGIPSSSSEEKTIARFSGCTHYVAGKFDVGPITGNAAQWNNNAPPGWVGSEPVKGSAMVFEPNVHGADGIAGHVAYVESVEITESGYKVTISEAQVVEDGKGGYVQGAHTEPTKRTIDIPKGGEGGVSFIYGPSGKK